MPVRFLHLVLATALALFLAPSVQPQAANSAAPTPAIAPGTLIQAEMQSDVDAKKARAGDVFRARVWGEVRTGDSIVLPQKTMLVGHVVSAQPRSKENSESRLIIAFDKAVLKNGTELPLRGVVARVQLSPLAVSAAAGASSASYKPGLNPGSTTNAAMPAQVPSPGEGGTDGNQLPTPGPTNIRDSSIVLQSDAGGTQTVLTSANKSDVKLKHYATLDLRITRFGD